MAEEPKIIVFNVKVQGGENRVAIDAISLKRFIDTKKFEYTMFAIDPSKLPVGATFTHYQALAFSDLFSTLENDLDSALGLNQQLPQDQPMEDEQMPPVDSTQEQDEEEEVQPQQRVAERLRQMPPQQPVQRPQEQQASDEDVIDI
jgi:hypothetical protein